MATTMIAAMIAMTIPTGRDLEDAPGEGPSAVT